MQALQMCKFPSSPILALLEAAERHRPIDHRALHAHTITSGLIRDTFAASRIVEFFLKWGPHQYARHVFTSLAQPDAYTWNALIAAHTDSPHCCLTYYFRMLEKQIPPPNTYTFALLVKACKNDIRTGRKVHGQILKRGAENLLIVRNSLMGMYCSMACMEEAQLLFDKSVDLDLISWNSMLSGYGKIGDVQAAKRLFDEMPQRNLVSWSAMIDGYVRNGDFSEALQQFNAMQGSGMEADVVVLVSVLKACAHLGALDQGRWIHLYVERNKLENGRNVVLWTALIDMYAKCGCIDVALDMFHAVYERDVVLWNAIIGGLAMHGHGRDALEFFSQMKSPGVAPNEITFVSVLCACTHAGLVEEGLNIFELMKTDYGIKPLSEHYGCLADLLGRAGRVQEAEKVLNDMPMEPQASQLGALMAACRTYNNVEVGERVGKRLISLEPHDGGRYVILSNMYAGAGQWGDALEMRRAMEEKGIKKEKGQSFIEWNGVVHEFAVGDTSHPLSRDINDMLEEIEKRLRSVGYVHDTSQMLLDMYDEEEKVLALSFHRIITSSIFLFSHPSPWSVVSHVGDLLRLAKGVHMKLIGYVRCRLKLIRNRRDTIVRHVRADIVQLLRGGHQDASFFRVEQLVKDQSILAAYDLLDHCCELILLNFPYIRKHRDCPSDIKEAISSLIFSAQDSQTLPELQKLRELFGKRYGNDLVMATGESFPGNLVNQQIDTPPIYAEISIWIDLIRFPIQTSEKLSTRPVSDDERFELIEEIAVQYDIQLWQPELGDGSNQQYQSDNIVKGLESFFFLFFNQKPSLFFSSNSETCDPRSEQGIDVLEKDIQVVYSDISRVEMWASNDEDMRNLPQRKNAKKSLPLQTEANSNTSSKSEEMPERTASTSTESSTADQSLHESKKCGHVAHVHPKLPDYDDLAAKFTALRKEYLRQNAMAKAAKIPDYDDLVAKFTAMRKEYWQQNAMAHAGYA
ncbi:hypothetical protein ACLOJK_020505 [Asimina triloba]